MENIKINEASAVNSKTIITHDKEYYKDLYNKSLLNDEDAYNNCTYEDTYGSIENTISTMDESEVKKFIEKVVNRAVLIDEHGEEYNGFFEDNRDALKKVYTPYAYFLRSDICGEDMTLEPFVVVDFAGIFFSDKEIFFPFRFDTDDGYINIKKLTVGRRVIFEKE